eukprot:g4533.t1
MSLLKAVKDKGVPLSIEAYRLRLDVLLRVRGRRRSIDQIHRALVDFVKNWPQNGPIFSQELYKRTCDALGKERVVGVFAVHTENGGEGLVAEDNLRYDALQQWQTANLNDDKGTFNKKKKVRGPAKVPNLDQGFRVLKRTAGSTGLPEWMGLKKPIRYGTAK